jgi:hypothetical protein
VRVEPRIVLGDDENRLAGAAALPFVLNPYLEDFFLHVDTAAVLLPRPGTYTVVFDSPGPAGAGAFRFRVWVDDVTPPAVRLLGRRAEDGVLRARVRDRGAGVDPESVTYRLDGGFWRSARVVDGEAILPVGFARPGPHLLSLRVSDRQEAKNNENVAGVLPNTTELAVDVVVPG